MHGSQPASSWNEDTVRQVLEVVHSDHHHMVEMTAEKVAILVCIATQSSVRI
jgi:hypothetical protein